MLELFSILGGAVTRLIGGYFDYKKQQMDNEHELALLQMQMELKQTESTLRSAEAQITGDIQIDSKWTDALATAVENQSQRTGVAFIDFVNMLQRPVMIYWHCLVLYTTYKAVLVYDAYIRGVPLMGIAELIMGEFDRALIGSMMSFLFVDRQLRKMYGAK